MDRLAYFECTPLVVPVAGHIPFLDFTVASSVNHLNLWDTLSAQVAHLTAAPPPALALAAAPPPLALVHDANDDCASGRKVARLLRLS